jgi:hypothetical protein
MVDVGATIQGEAGPKPVVESKVKHSKKKEA